MLQTLFEQPDDVLIVERVIDLTSRASRPHEPHPAQQPELMGHGRLADADLAGDVADTELRARHGIEFFDFSKQALAHWQTVRQSQGVSRFAAFCAFLADLAHRTDYRLLSSTTMKAEGDGSDGTLIDTLVQRVMREHEQPLSAGALAAELGMTESRFSRFFRRATGSTFPEFVNRVRVNHAGQLLMESDRPVSSICYEVGFNNISNFNRRFLEVKGVTPSEYRRQAGQRFGGAAA